MNIYIVTHDTPGNRVCKGFLSPVNADDCVLRLLGDRLGSVSKINHPNGDYTYNWGVISIDRETLQIEDAPANPTQTEKLKDAFDAFNTYHGCWTGRMALTYAKRVKTHLITQHQLSHFTMERPRDEVRLYNMEEQEYWWPQGAAPADLANEIARHKDD